MTHENQWQQLLCCFCACIIWFLFFLCVNWCSAMFLSIWVFETFLYFLIPFFSIFETFLWFWDIFDLNGCPYISNVIFHFLLFHLLRNMTLKKVSVRCFLFVCLFCFLVCGFFFHSVYIGTTNTMECSSDILLNNKSNLNNI